MVIQTISVGLVLLMATIHLMLPLIPALAAVSRAAPSIATRATRWIRRWSMMRMAEEKNNNLKEHGYESSD